MKRALSKPGVLVSGRIESQSASSRGVLKAPVVLLTRANSPLPVLLLPVVLLKSANSPLAVLLSPVVFLARASSPLAVLPSPVVLPARALALLAVLLLPLMFLKRAWFPRSAPSLPKNEKPAGGARTQKRDQNGAIADATQLVH